MGPSLVWVTCLSAVALGMKATQLETIIYRYLPGDGGSMSFCSRKLNTTGQVGCQSAREPGNRGTLIFVGGDQTKLNNYLLKDKTSSEMAPFSFMIELSLMTKENMQKLKHVNQENVRGGGIVSSLVVYRNSSVELDVFSPDYACPGLGPECDHPWNPSGSGIMWNDYPFPIVFYRDNSIVDELRGLYDKYNARGEYPAVQYQVAVRMQAATDTPTCIRRSSKQQNFEQSAANTLCDPYGQFNTLAAFPPANNSDPNEVQVAPDDSTVALVVRSDALSFFQNLASGFEQIGIAFVLQLAIAKAINETSAQSELEKFQRSVALMTLAGEDFKNIGASSTLYSMSDLNAFPRSFTNISDGGAVVSQTLNGAQAVLQAQQVDQPKQYKTRSFKNIIEVGQLLIPKETESLFLHGKETVPQNVFDVFEKHFKSFRSIKKATGGFGFPSTTISAMSSGDPDLAEKAAYFGNFDTEFSNKYFNSMFDTNSSLGFSFDTFCSAKSEAKLGADYSKLATSLTRSAVELALEGTDADLAFLDQISVQDETIQELFCCFLGGPEQCDNVSNLINITSSGYYFPGKLPPKFSFSPNVARLNQNSANWFTSSPLLKTFATTMAYYTGIPVYCNSSDPTNKTDCFAKCQNDKFESASIDNLYNYWLLNNDTECRKTALYFNAAISPAFQIEGYDLALNPKNYSLWTESEWLEVRGARLFLVQSPVTQNIALSVGIISLFVAFFISWTIRWKSATLFEAPEGIVNPVSAAAT